MTHDQKDGHAHAPSPDKPERYEVGYGKPPSATRFKPGQSGNPHGRPKGSKNIQPPIGENTLQDIILKEAYRPIIPSAIRTDPHEPILSYQLI